MASSMSSSPQRSENWGSVDLKDGNFMCTPTEPRAAVYVRNDGEIRWNLNDLDVATVEELEPEGCS